MSAAQQFPRNFSDTTTAATSPAHGPDTRLPSLSELISESGRQSPRVAAWAHPPPLQVQPSLIHPHQFVADSQQQQLSYDERHLKRPRTLSNGYPPPSPGVAAPPDNVPNNGIMLAHDHQEQLSYDQRQAKRPRTFSSGYPPPSPGLTGPPGNAHNNGIVLPAPQYPSQEFNHLAQPQQQYTNYPQQLSSIQQVKAPQHALPSYSTEAWPPSRVQAQQSPVYQRARPLSASVRPPPPVQAPRPSNVSAVSNRMQRPTFNESQRSIPLTSLETRPASQGRAAPVLGTTERSVTMGNDRTPSVYTALGAKRTYQNNTTGQVPQPVSARMQTSYSQEKVPYGAARLPIPMHADKILPLDMARQLQLPHHHPDKLAIPIQVVNEIVAHCQALYDFASRYAQKRASSLDARPSAEELVEMRTRAGKVVKLLENVRKVPEVSPDDSRQYSTQAHPNGVGDPRTGVFERERRASTSVRMDFRPPQGGATSSDGDMHMSDPASTRPSYENNTDPSRSSHLRPQQQHTPMTVDHQVMQSREAASSSPKDDRIRLAPMNTGMHNHSLAPQLAEDGRLPKRPWEEMAAGSDGGGSSSSYCGGRPYDSQQHISNLRTPSQPDIVSQEQQLPQQAANRGGETISGMQGGNHAHYEHSPHNTGGAPRYEQGAQQRTYDPSKPYDAGADPTRFAYDPATRANGESGGIAKDEVLRAPSGNTSPTKDSTEALNSGQTTAESDMALIRSKRSGAMANSSNSEAAEDGSSKKYRKRSQRVGPPGQCHSCNIRETPEWRRGPDGARTLCNACGLHYAKLVRKRNKALDEPPISIEVLRASARSAESTAAARAQRNSQQQQQQQQTQRSSNAALVATPYIVKLEADHQQSMQVQNEEQRDAGELEYSLPLMTDDKQQVKRHARTKAFRPKAEQVDLPALQYTSPSQSRHADAYAGSKEFQGSFGLTGPVSGVVATSSSVSAIASIIPRPSTSSSASHVPPPPWENAPMSAGKPYFSDAHMDGRAFSLGQAQPQIFPPRPS
ncbi:hypothetical protein FISHEDRAFT_62140 [Fistulina hepatica ATCC 64428]|nr:hypothetical protein FISHEDRAFT_62140 [Fistulina hepatica ATCC 64428]